MSTRKIISAAIAGSLVVGGFGCESLPGGEREQGAVIGGVTGAAAGALIGGDDNRLVGALLGGALGAGGGYLIGMQLDKDDEDRDEAITASKRAEQNPATAEQALSARTADVNSDGYVTLDEVVAMEKAGLSDDQIIDRLDKTDMVFDLGTKQRQYLRDNGVSERVVTAMKEVNPDIRREAEARAAGATIGSTPVGKK